MTYNHMSTKRKHTYNSRQFARNLGRSFFELCFLIYNLRYLLLEWHLRERERLSKCWNNVLIIYREVLAQIAFIAEII